MTLKDAMYKAVDEPLPWYIYLLVPAGALAGNFCQLGISQATFNGGLLVGGVLLVVMLTARRYIVGHWR